MSDERSHAIRFHLEPNQLVISSQNAEEGEASETIQPTTAEKKLTLDLTLSIYRTFLTLSAKQDGF